MANIDAQRFRRSAALVALIGSAPVFVWSCQDAHPTVTGAPPPTIIKSQEYQTSRRTTAPPKDREIIRRKLDDLSGQIDQLKATIRAQKDAESQ